MERDNWHAHTCIYRQDYVQTYKDTYIHTADKQTGRQTHVLCVSSSLCTGTVAGWAAGRWISLKNEVCDTSANKKGFKRAPEGHFDSFKKKVFRKILCSTSCYLASPKKHPRASHSFGMSLTVCSFLYGNPTSSLGLIGLGRRRPKLSSCTPKELQQQQQ